MLHLFSFAHHSILCTSEHNAAFHSYYENITVDRCISYVLQEEMMRGKPGYEHLNEPLHILVEAELPVEIVDARLMQAREILEDLLKPMVSSLFPSPVNFYTFLHTCLSFLN